jgi:hypothetical protein
MSCDLLVIENIPKDSSVEPAKVAEFFGAKDWIAVGCSADHCVLRERKNEGGFSKELELPSPPLIFYQNLIKKMPRGAVLFRLRNPSYPFHASLLSEMNEGFPFEKYDYVLSTGEECGLAGYFAERLNLASLKAIARTEMAMMPAGSF